MKTIEINNADATVDCVLGQANDEDVIFRFPDGREYFVSAVDDFDLEIIETRRDDAIMKLLEHRRRPGQTAYSSAEVRAKLGLPAGA